MPRRCWLAGQPCDAPDDHPPVVDAQGRTWAHVGDELYREELSGHHRTFTELVARTDLVEVT